jgi:hypothetical protein
MAAEWRLWARCLLACVVACGLLGALVLVAGDPAQTRALWSGGGWFTQLGAVCVIWLLFGPVWATASHRINRSKETTPCTERGTSSRV